MNQLEVSVLFGSLPQQNRRWGSFATSFSLQTAAILVLGGITLTAPGIVQKPFEHVELAAPTDRVQARKQQQFRIGRAPLVVKPAHKMQAGTEPIAPPEISVPPPVLPKRESAMSVPALPVPAPRFDSLHRPAAPLKVDRQVQINVFNGSSTPETLPKMAAAKVQTGGFGDPNGAPANANTNARQNVATTGSFDLPSGSGHGNGSGGARGARGVVATTGFGQSSSIENRPAAPRGRVQTTGFETVAASETKKAPQPQKVMTIPVAIQEKPNPVYTPEARKLHIEGEVLLQVVFTASGQVRVVRVVRGLGHGLDEAAVRAAEKIHFSPAQHYGHTVDSTATLHIVFQLS